MGVSASAAPTATLAADLAAIRAQFHPAPGITYLDSATYGLPPQAAVDALDRATRLWQAGTGDWVTDWDAPSDSAPRDFARLIGAAEDTIATIPAASDIGVASAFGS